MKNKHPFLRFLLFAAEILLLWLLQATPGLMPALFGTKPFLLLAGALAIASCEEAAALLRARVTMFENGEE